MTRKNDQLNLKTKRFIRSRRISEFLPWFGIFGILILVFSLIMNGLLLFVTEIGFVANFYYFIDTYNWLADRLSFDPRKKLLTHKKDELIKVIMWLIIILASLVTGLLIWLNQLSFLFFFAGLSFISICYFGSRAIENGLVLFHLQLNNWKRFYTIVATGTVFLISLSIILLCYDWLIFYIFFAVIGMIYLLTYYILIEVYRRTENDLGGHKYFIDLPDNRFVKKNLY